LPVEDYNRLSIEKISRRVEKLSSDEITELKAYEEQRKTTPPCWMSRCSRSGERTIDSKLDVR
jgi:hypothetical protein